MTKPRVLKEGKYIRLLESDGWEYVERMTGSGVVVVVAITRQQELVLTEQFRVAPAARVIDFPAGLVGDVPGQPHEDLAEAARRELLEETGYAPERLDYLAAGPSSPGLSTEILTFFLARDARRVGPGGGDETEDIQVHLVPLGGVDDWLEQRQRHGALIDAKIYGGLYLACRPH